MNKQGIGRKFYFVTVIFLVSLIFINLLYIFLGIYKFESYHPKKIFSVDKIGEVTGRQATQSGTVKIRIMRRCDEFFHSGFTLFSIYKNLTNNSIESVFPSDINDIEVLYEWDENQQSFKVFSPLAATNPFTTLNLNKSYMVLFPDDYNCVIYDGNDFDDVEISLSSGINAVNYPYNFTSNVSDYTQDIQSFLRYVLKWNRTLEEFVVYSPLAVDQQFYDIKKAEGQFIGMISPQTLYYNRSALV